MSGEESRHGERVERSRVGRLAKLVVIALAGLVGATALWVAEFNPGEWIQAITPTPRAPQARPHPEAPLTVVEPRPLGTTSSVSPLPVALHLVATRPGRNVHVAANRDAAAAYFEHGQDIALARWIDSNGGQVVVYGHSWGGATAAGVVAAGHNVMELVTVDPVSYSRPNFSAVAANAGVWLDFSASGGEGFSWSNVVSYVGRAWGSAPSTYATGYMQVNENHVGVMCAVSPSGCSP